MLPWLDAGLVLSGEDFGVAIVIVFSETSNSDAFWSRLFRRSSIVTVLNLGVGFEAVTEFVDIRSGGLEWEVSGWILETLVNDDLA